MGKRLSPWPLWCPGPLRYPPRPSPSLVQVLRLFGKFCLAHRGVNLRLRAKAVISDAQGGTRGVRCLNGAVQGPPMDPSDSPIARLVERDT